MNSKLPCALAVLGGLLVAASGRAEVWQWSVPSEKGRVYLWVPPDCKRVRAVVVGQNNMIEGGILEHPAMREALAAEGIAEVWAAPPFDGVFRFDQGAGERFEAMMQALAQASGYTELATAPVVPIGHSACASYPWNFAAWNPARTLAVLSVHGDAPLTNLTGSGRPNPDWGDRNIDGVPALMAMGEYEWSDERLEPALAYRRAHPRSCIAMLAEPGRGHFDYSDDLVKFLALFIRKAVAARLPRGDETTLRPVDPGAGWLVERWHLERPRATPPAPAADYQGDPAQAFWAFDAETARAIQDYRADQVGRKPQLVAYVQDGKAVAQTQSHQQVNLRFEPEADGITFRLGTAFLESVTGDSSNLARWTGLPVGAPLGHAERGGPITITRITGPVTKIDADTFALCLDRDASSADTRRYDIWLAAEQEGDDAYKSVVQQALLRVTPNRSGRPQHIDFPEIGDQQPGGAGIELTATSDAGTTVRYYVREGPAEIVDGHTLHFTSIPLRARFPVTVTVVAWQWGRADAPGIQTAEPVTRTFRIAP